MLLPHLMVSQPFTWQHLSQGWLPSVGLIIVEMQLGKIAVKADLYYADA